MNKRLALAVATGMLDSALVGGMDRPPSARKKKKPTKNELYHWSRKARKVANKS